MPMEPMPDQLKSCEDQKTSGPLPYAALRLVYDESELGAYRTFGVVLMRFLRLIPHEPRGSRHHQSDPAKIHRKLRQNLLVTPSQHVAGHDGEKDAKAENLQGVSSNESDPLDPPVAQPFMVSGYEM
jgi:hypothetical protein